MQDIRTPPSSDASHLARLRTWAGWAVAALATLLTVLTAVAARSASTQVHDKDADIGWFVAGVVALIAIAAWIAALVLFRMTRWAIYVVAAVLMLLTATGVYGGIRDEGGEPGLVLVSLLTVPVWLLAIVWNRTRTRRQ